MLYELNDQKNSESYVSSDPGGDDEVVDRPGNNNSTPACWPLLSFHVDPETEFRFRKLQQKLEKERKQKISFNEVLSAVMDMVEELARLKTDSRRQADSKNSEWKC